MQDSSQDSGSLIEARIFLNTIAFLAILIAVAGAASYFVQAGQFKEVVQGGKAVKVYQTVAQTPVPIWKILLSPVLCLTGKNGPKLVVLILFILFIGGSFSIMNKSGALPALLAQLTEKFANRKTLFVVVNVLAFGVMSSSLGIMEEIVPMILFFVPIAYRMGWDSMMGMALPFLSSGLGFAAAMFNPFTVGTAQKLADIPVFSGLYLRAPFFLVCMALGAFYLLRYVRRIEKDPTLSLTYNDDLKYKQETQSKTDVATLERPRAVVGVIGFCFLLIVGVVVGGTQVKVLQDLAFPIIALVFLVMGFGVGFFSGTQTGHVFRFFAKGLADFAPAVLLILMAASVGYLIEVGGIMDTVLNNMAHGVRGMGQGSAAVTIYFFQMMMNLFVPSGTGQAVLTIPILAPLGDMIGLSRQTVVLAYQCGDGFSNLLWPTNPVLLIALGLARIRYKAWLRFIIPIQLALMAVSVGFLYLAVAIGYR